MRRWIVKYIVSIKKIIDGLDISQPVIFSYSLNEVSNGDKLIYFLKHDSALNEFVYCQDGPKQMYYEVATVST